MKYGILMTAALMGCGSSPQNIDIKEGALSTSEQPLYVDLDNPDLGYLTRPVCYTSADASLGLTPEKERMFKDGILASWGAVTQLRFTGWDLCPNPDNRSRIVQVSSCGNCSSGAYRVANGAGMSFAFQQWEEWARWGGVHEMGHALGFWHEQARLENIDSSWCNGFQDGSWATEPRSANSVPYGVFDPFSVMNYCQHWVVPPRAPVQPGADHDQPDVGSLSAIDIKGAQQYYQAREYRRQVWASNTVRQTIVQAQSRRLEGQHWSSKDGRVLLSLVKGKLGVSRSDYPNLPPFWSVGPFSNNKVTAVFGFDGNLSLIDAKTHTTYWSSGTTSSVGATMSVQQDGNVVIYDAGGVPRWSTGTAHRDELEGAVGLLPDESLVANDSQHNAKTTASGQYQLIMQTDGNLVVYEDPSGAHTPLWATGTWGSGATTAKLRLDGTLVLMNSAGQTVWYSAWPGWRAAAFLALREDGNLVVYEPTKYEAWSAIPYSSGQGSETTGTNSPAYDNGRVILWNGETLAAGTDIATPSGMARLRIDPVTGDVFVYLLIEVDDDVWDWNLVWSTNAPGVSANSSLHLTDDGNLQLINSSTGEIRWSSNTPGYRNTYLGLSDSGRLSIFRVISLGAQNIGFLY